MLACKRYITKSSKEVDMEIKNSTRRAFAGKPVHRNIEFS